MDEDDYTPDAVVAAWLEEHDEDVDPVELAALENPAVWARLWRDGLDFGCYERDWVAAYANLAWPRGAIAILSRDEWREVFALAGYRENGEVAERPRESLTLWRGAVPHWRYNWSWTSDRDLALTYASSYWVQEQVGLVWCAEVEPVRLLAKIGWEYVVDTDGLTIEPDGLWCRCSVDLAPFRGNDAEAQTALDLHELVTCVRR